MSLKNKPNKPYPTFPLTPHNRGKWCKKINGDLVYFGTWDDPDGALQEYLTYLGAKDDKPKQFGPLNVETACNLFLDAKDEAVQSGELSQRTFNDYRRTCRRLVERWGKVPVEALTPLDFSSYRSAMRDKWNLISVGNEVTRIKTFLRWLHDAGHVPEIKTGKEFRKPTAKAVRRYRRERGKKMFQEEEIRRLLNESGTNLRAMIYLGINCGFQGSDCEKIPLSVVANAIKTGWMEYPREKTEVERRCPLWPRTVKALEAAHRRRPASNRSEFFLLPNGEPYSSTNCDIPKRFQAARQFALLSSKGDPGFSWLRKTFETIAGQSKDQVAVDYIMGHVDSTMAGVYRQEIQDDRLIEVTDVVHEWLTKKSLRRRRGTQTSKAQAHR